MTGDVEPDASPGDLALDVTAADAEPDAPTVDDDPDGSSGDDAPNEEAESEVPTPRPPFLRFELAASAIVVVCSSVFLVRVMRWMGDSSLWGDELFSIIRFSGQGPGASLTRYSNVNNHVFFNFVNSITPGAGSVDPFRARLWSYVATAIVLGLVLYEFGRRRWYLMGAGVFAAFAINFTWLDLVLQARGYGFDAAAAMVSSVAVWRYLEDPRRRWLAVLGGATLVGAWSLPNYMFFGAFVFLVLLVTVRRWEVFVAGAITGAAIVAAYLPLVSQVRKQYTTTFSGDVHGRPAGTLTDPWRVADSLRKYLFNGDVKGHGFPTIGIVALFLAVVVLALWGPVSNEIRRLTLVLMGATTLFYAIAVKMNTIDRTTAFAAIPLAVVVGAVGGDVFAQLRRPVWLRPALTVVIALGLCGASFSQVRSYDFLPEQNWRDAGTYIRKVFPDGTRVAGTSDPFGFRVLYAGSGVRLARKLDPQAFSDGRLVIVDTSVTSLPHFNPGLAFAAAKPPLEVTDVRIPQRSGGYTRVLAAPPLDSHIERITIDGEEPSPGTLDDRNPFSSYRTDRVEGEAKDVVIHVVPTPGTISRSITMITGSELPRPVEIVVTLADGRKERLPTSGQFVAEHIAALSLGDVEAKEITLTIGPVPDGSQVHIRDMWIYPASTR